MNLISCGKTYKITYRPRRGQICIATDTIGGENETVSTTLKGLNVNSHRIYSVEKTENDFHNPEGVEQKVEKWYSVQE